MRSLLILIALFALSFTVTAQDFVKAMTTAKTSYNAGKLEETHFALEQAMQEIDLIIGQEVLKLLPKQMETLAVNPKDDNVSSNIGFVGATIHRSYGAADRKADLSIISNSPVIAMLNSFFNTHMLAGMMNDGKTKTVKVQGYKARLEKQDGAVEGKTNYELQVPLGSALITFKVDDINDTKMLAMANMLPLADIAKLIQ